MLYLKWSNMENQRRDIRILTILLIVQYIFTTFTFPRLYRNELVLFNSNFNKMETQQLLVALTYLIFFSLLGYKQLRGHISKAFKTISLSVIYLLVPIFHYLLLKIATHNSLLFPPIVFGTI